MNYLEEINLIQKSLDFITSERLKREKYLSEKSLNDLENVLKEKLKFIPNVEFEKTEHGCKAFLCGLNFSIYHDEIDYLFISYKKLYNFFFFKIVMSRSTLLDFYGSDEYEITEIIESHLKALKWLSRKN